MLLISLLVFLLLMLTPNSANDQAHRHQVQAITIVQPQQQLLQQQPSQQSQIKQAQIVGTGKQTGFMGNAKPAITPHSSSREVEKAIVDQILGEGYDKRIRPAGSGLPNASKPGEFRRRIPFVAAKLEKDTYTEILTYTYTVK